MEQEHKSKKHHDWRPIREIFFSGEVNTLDDLAKKTGISISTIAKRAADEKWFQQRNEMEAEAQSLAREAIVKKRASEIAEVQTSHLHLARLLQHKGLEFLKGKSIKTEALAISAIKIGVEIERQTLGMDASSESVGSVNQNFAIVVPGTMTIEEWKQKAVEMATKTIDVTEDKEGGES